MKSLKDKVFFCSKNDEELNPYSVSLDDGIDYDKIELELNVINQENNRASILTAYKYDVNPILRSKKI